MRMSPGETPFWCVSAKFRVLGTPRHALHVSVWWLQLSKSLFSPKGCIIPREISHALKQENWDQMEILYHLHPQQRRKPYSQDHFDKQLPARVFGRPPMRRGSSVLGTTCQLLIDPKA
jgi:hypothetical protein